MYLDAHLRWLAVCCRECTAVLPCVAAVLQVCCSVRARLPSSLHAHSLRPLLPSTSHSHTLSLSLTHCLSHTQTHTHALSLSLIHSVSQTHTLCARTRETTLTTRMRCVATRVRCVRTLVCCSVLRRHLSMRLLRTLKSYVV